MPSLVSMPTKRETLSAEIVHAVEASMSPLIWARPRASCSSRTDGGDHYRDRQRLKLYLMKVMALPGHTAHPVANGIRVSCARLFE